METVQIIFQFEEGGYKKISFEFNPKTIMSEVVDKLKIKASELKFENYEFYLDDKIVNQNLKLYEFHDSIIIISVRKRSYLTKCPDCEANTCFLKIENYGLHFWGCPHGHKCTKTFSRYEESQKINYGLIKCDKCHKTCREVKEMFKCLTCSKKFQRSCYFCSECNAEYEKAKGAKHNVIKYDDKNYFCLCGSEYSFYCLTCNTDFCEKCENNHKNHNIVKYDTIAPKIKSIKNELEKIRFRIAESKAHIDQILRMIEDASSILDKYYAICMDMVGKYESYNTKLKNYHVISNINFLETSNKIVLNDLNEFMKGDNNKEDYLSKCEKLFDIVYKERGNFTGKNNVNTSQKIEVSTQASKNYINQKEEPKNGKFYK